MFSKNIFSQILKFYFVNKMEQDDADNYSIVQLPSELLLEIILRLDPADLVQFCSSSKEMQELCGDRVWIKLIKRDFQLTQTEIEDRLKDKPQSYIELYLDLTKETKYVNLVDIIDDSVHQAYRDWENQIPKQQKICDPFDIQ